MPALQPSRYNRRNVLPLHLGTGLVVERQTKSQRQHHGESQKPQRQAGQPVHGPDLRVNASAAHGRRQNGANPQQRGAVAVVWAGVGSHDARSRKTTAAAPAPAATSPRDRLSPRVASAATASQHSYFRRTFGANTSEDSHSHENTGKQDVASRAGSLTGSRSTGLSPRGAEKYRLAQNKRFLGQTEPVRVGTASEPNTHDDQGLGHAAWKGSSMRGQAAGASQTGGQHRRSKSHGSADLVRLDTATLAAAAARDRSRLRPSTSSERPSQSHRGAPSRQRQKVRSSAAPPPQQPRNSGSGGNVAHKPEISEEIRAKQRAGRARQARRQRLALIRREISKAASAIGGMNNFMGKFHVVDKNHDGNVDYDEFRSLCGQLMPGLPRTEVEFLIQCIDPDEKGYVFDLKFFAFIETHLHLHTKRVLHKPERREPKSITSTPSLLRANPLHTNASTAKSLSSHGNRYRHCVKEAVDHLLTKKKLNLPPRHRRQRFDTWMRINSVNMDTRRT